ncbi:MAG: VOC family protein [Armatimonadetes bacterium]|nr:VOC family protein [Armatimonadota bacterium]
MAKNTICHVEWDVTDLARAQEFYGALFDWTFRQFGDDMVVFGTGEQHLGGFMKVDAVKAGSSPSIWIEVEDLEAQLAKAQGIGARVIKGKSAVPNVGWSGQVSDPDGNSIGMVQFGSSDS